METVIDSLVDALSAITVALIGVGVFRTSRRIKRVQHHVENDHDTNLRDDLDRKFVGLANLVGAAQRDITWLIRRHVELDKRVDDVEDTITKGKKES